MILLIYTYISFKNLNHYYPITFNYSHTLKYVWLDDKKVKIVLFCLHISNICIFINVYIFYTATLTVIVCVFMNLNMKFEYWACYNITQLNYYVTLLLFHFHSHRVLDIK